MKDTDSSKLVPGCKNGKHCSEHHEDYPYAAYSTFIRNEVSIAIAHIYMIHAMTEGSFEGVYV